MTEQKTTDDLLKVEDLMKLFGLSRGSIYNMIRRDGLPRPLRLTVRAVRWRRGDVLAWLAARKNGGSRA